MGLQLRLWLTVIVLLAAGVLVLLLGTSALSERMLLPFDTLSMQSVVAAEGALIKHADDTIEAVTKASVEEPVRAASKKGEMTPEAEAALLSHTGSLSAPSFALLVRPDGSVAAHAGVDVKIDGPLAGFPAFAEAATGIARDGVHSFDGKTFQIAAAPVYDGAAVSGVIILGWPYDAAFIDKMAQTVGAPIILTTKTERVGDALKNLSNAELKIRGAGVGELDIKPLPSFLPILMDHGRYTFVSRPLSFGGDDASLVIATDRNEGFRALAWSQALVIGGTLLITLLQLILVLTTMRSVSKPIEVIVDHLSQVSQGNSVGILPEAALRGQFLRLGKQVNMILQLMPSAARPGQALGALQGPSPLPGTPPGVPTPSLAGMANGGGLTNGRETSGASLANLGDMTLDTRTPSASLSTASARATPSQPPRGADAPPSGLSGLFDEGAPDPLAAFRVAPPAQPAPQAKPAARSHEPPPQPAFEPSFDDAPQPDTAAGPSAMSPEATVMFQVPQELLNQSAQIGGSNLPQRPVTDELPSRPPTSRPMADDARTVVAQVPQELLSAAAPKDNLSNADEAHYKDVYDKFVETRVQCGEDTSDLTYDRFVAKLLKNRQQIIEKHKAKSVRFQVYVKEGKAALRALPVRE